MTGTGWRILVTDPLAQEGLQVLSDDPRCEVVLKPGLTGDALRGELARADALLVRSGTQVTAELLESTDRLRVVGRAGTGVDNIDVDAATARGVVVMNTPGGNSVAATELTFALLLALMRNVPRASQDLQAGNWNRKQFVGHQLDGHTLGLLGFGRIGREVAHRASAFGMRVLVDDPFVTDALVREWNGKLVDRATLLAESDVVSLHLPLTEETRHCIDREAIAAMKQGAVLVNCARGGLVDETALHEALESGHLAGAAFDVFETEPPRNSPLVGHPRVVTTPHLGASTAEAQLNVAAQIAEQVLAYLRDGEVRNAVNMPSLSAELYAQVRPYLDLARRLGALAGRIAGAPYRNLEVVFRGECAELPRAPVTSAALVGLLGTAPAGSGVNYVNARLRAQAIGLQVEERAREDAGDQTGLIEISVTGSERSATVAGWVTAAGRLRLARWDGLGLDAPPEGEILVLRNPDVPGVVGAIGSLLGGAGINIAHIAWGRDAESREALTLICVDAPIPPELLERIAGDGNVLWAKAVSLH